MYILPDDINLREVPSVMLKELLFRCIAHEPSYRRVEEEINRRASLHRKKKSGVYKDRVYNERLGLWMTYTVEPIVPEFDDPIDDAFEGDRALRWEHDL